MAIVINGSGTLTGLAVGGLPDGTVDSGTLATDSVVTGKIADGTIANADIADLAASKLTGALPAISGASLTGFTDAQMPAGSSVQVVQALSTTQTVIGTSFTACAPTVTITPSSSSNKILVRFNTGGMANGGVDAIRLQIKRGSTVIKYSIRYGYSTVTGWFSTPITYEILDSPSTTSATTYTLEGLRQTSGSFEINSSGGTNSASAIAMEIKG